MLSGSFLRGAQGWLLKRCVVQVEVHHCGLYHFKGLSELQNVVQINSTQMAGREFPDRLPTKKGKLVGPARGLQFVVTMK